jgi:hypothetical protein
MAAGQKELKQVTRSTGADSYTAMKRMACNNSRWKATNQSKDKRIRRRTVKCLIIVLLTTDFTLQIS